MKRSVASSGLAALLFFPLQASAAALTILVAPAESTAFSAAKATADGTVTVAESKLFKAFDQAAEHLVGCGANNVFLNNVFTWQVGSANHRHVPRRYVVEHNSFIRNWPYNPDATTSNPGTLQIGNKHTAAKSE